MEGFCSKSIITICRFYKLYGDLWCRVSSGGGGWGGGVWWPMRHNMSGLNLTLQWHLWAPHVHDNSHVGVMFSSSSPLYVPMFISV